MAPTTGISGIGAAIIGGGAVLAYAGFRGVSPLQALKDIASGDPPSIEGKRYLRGRIDPSSASAGSSTNSLVQAAMAFKNDQYSQGRRWQEGYSDCSSFVGKALKKIGITPPGGSTTWSYLSSPQWRKIARSEAQAGDLAVNATHMAIFIDNATGIGQQNPRRNVQSGPIDELMSGTGGYTCLRYVGSTGSGRSAEV